MCTASHNPKAYTGAKLVGEARSPCQRRLGHPGHPPAERSPASATRPPRPAASSSSTSPHEFRARGPGVHRPGHDPPLRIVVDGGNGMAGTMVGPIFDRLGIDL